MHRTGVRLNLAGAPDLMTQRTETAAPIASVYYFRCPIAQRFHAVVLTSARVLIFGVVTLNVGQVSFVAFDFSDPFR